METNKRGRDQRSEISVVECYSRGKSNADDTVSDAVKLHSIVSYFLVIFILRIVLHKVQEQVPTLHTAMDRTKV